MSPKHRSICRRVKSFWCGSGWSRHLPEARVPLLIKLQQWVHDSCDQTTCFMGHSSSTIGGSHGFPQVLPSTNKLNTVDGRLRGLVSVTYVSVRITGAGDEVDLPGTFSRTVFAI